MGTAWAVSLVAVALALVFWAESQADVYSYTGKDGTIVITDQKPKGREYNVLVDDAPRARPFALSPDTTSDYDRYIAHYARKTGLSTALLRAVIKTESNFNHKAVSPKGACGLMQLMPGTWAMFGVEDPFDPEENIRAGSAYFREQYDRFKDVNLAMAAYNAGPEAVGKYNGVPPYDETQNFVKVVNLYWAHYRDRERNEGPLKGPDIEAPRKSLLDDDFEGRLIRVYDGDKIAVELNGKTAIVRLYGIDCPDEGQPFAEDARRFAEDLATGSNVKILFKSRDKWDRIIGEVVLEDGRNLNHELLIEGLAWWLKSQWPEDRTYQSLETAARSTRRYVWSLENPEPPWEWRKNRKTPPTGSLGGSTAESTTGEQ